MFKEVCPNVFQFPRPDGGAVYVVRTGDGLVLFDSGFLKHRDLFLEGMRQAGLDPKDIRLGFITHVHCDHAGGMGWWMRQFVFPVVAHKQIVDPVEKADPVITAARMPYIGIDEEFVPCPVEHRVQGGETFRVGGREFHIIYAPGHAVGSIHILSENVLVVGDTLFADGGIGWMDVHWGSHPEDYIETLERMRAHRGLLVLPGHGECFVLDDARIDKGKEIVSFYIPSGHGLGLPRAPSHYA